MTPKSFIREMGKQLASDGFPEPRNYVERMNKKGKEKLDGYLELREKRMKLEE